VGDAEFQKKCIGKMGELRRSGRTVLFVSHNMAAVENLCDNTMLLKNGQVARIGPAREVIQQYLSEYSDKGLLLESVSFVGSRRIEIKSIDVECDGPLPVIAGGPMRIVMEIECKADCSNVEFGFGIDSTKMVRLATVWTGFFKDRHFTFREGDQRTVVCEIDSIPLNKGKYYLTIYIASANEVILATSGELSFSIGESDYFGTGNLPSTSQGELLLKHRWDIREDQPSDN